MLKWLKEQIENKGSKERQGMKETFSRSIRDKEVFFKHAKGERDVFGKEMHTFHEIFMFIGGEADFITESGREPLVPYTVAVIPRGSFHQFTVLGEEGDYHRAVLQFEDAEPWKSFFDAKMRRARVVHSQSLRDVFSRLIALCEQGRDKKEESALLRAFLTEALAYLPSDEKKKAPEGAFHALTYEAIRYIEDHLLSPLLVETVSDALHVSPSYLAHEIRQAGPCLSSPTHSTTHQSLATWVLPPVPQMCKLFSTSGPLHALYPLANTL